MELFKRKYENIQVFNEYLDDTSKAMPDNERYSLSKEPSKNWDNNTNIDQAMGLLENGWIEGSEKISNLNISLNNTGNQYVSELSFEPSMEGEILEVEKYFEGDPECFYSIEQTEKKMPVVKIGIPTVISYSATSSQIENRGIALLSLINAIEKNNISVELWAFSYVENDRNNKGLLHEIKVKASDTPFDIDKMAFICIHPAMGRRIIFRAMENEDKNIRNIFSISKTGNYGMPKTYESKEYDLLPDYKLENFNTKEKSEKWIKENCEKVGINIE